MKAVKVAEGREKFACKIFVALTNFKTYAPKAVSTGN